MAWDKCEGTSLSFNLHCGTSFQKVVVISNVRAGHMSIRSSWTPPGDVNTFVLFSFLTWQSFLFFFEVKFGNYAHIITACFLFVLNFCVWVVCLHHLLLLLNVIWCTLMHSSVCAVAQRMTVCMFVLGFCASVCIHLSACCVGAHGHVIGRWMDSLSEAIGR